MRDTHERLRDIQQAITQIMKYTHQGRDQFDQTYFGINFNRVWSIVEHDLPDLKASIDAILNARETD